jgi:hypothetical protein
MLVSWSKVFTDTQPDDASAEALAINNKLDMSRRYPLVSRLLSMENIKPRHS